MRHLLFFFSFCPFLLQAQKDSLINNLDAAVCTAVVNPTSVRNAVYPVKVIDEKVIQQRAVNNLEELLAGETNFRFKSDLIIGSGLQIGGIGSENIKILVDGVPVIGRLNGNIDLSQIPLYNVKQVEVIQGSLSAIYGSNAAGGVINIITKKSQLKPFEVRLNSLVESINMQNHSLNLGYRYKKLLVQTGAAFYQFTGLPSDTLRNVSWKPKQQLSSNTTFKYYIDEAQQLTYTYNIFKEKIDNLGEIKLPTKEYAYAFDDYYHTTRSDQNLNYQGAWRKLHVQSTLAFNHFYRLKEAYQTRIKQGTRTLVEMGQDTSAFAGLLSRTVASYQHSSRLNFQSGIEAYNESTHSLKIVDSSQQNKHFSSIADYAFFALAKIQPFNNQFITLQPALRIAYNTKYKAPLMPSLNVLLKPTRNWTIRASYAKGFRAPSLKELYFNFIDINHYVLGNQDLKAENTDNFILNPSYSVQNDNRMWTIEAQLFYNHIKDRITLARYDVANLKYTYFKYKRHQYEYYL
jgi:outer membrane receptor for ferrienterochelin and colicins